MLFLLLQVALVKMGNFKLEMRDASDGLDPVIHDKPWYKMYYTFSRMFCYCVFQ